MGRVYTAHFVSLKSSLINLPISLYGPLLERSVRPQHLAVHLKLVPAPGSQKHVKTEAYVGWTGMAASSSLAHFNRSSAAGDASRETFEIDPQFAEALGFKQGDTVEVGLIHDMSIAKTVEAEPVSIDDWEIVEIHAEYIESTLLNQVRVAAIGQEVDVWVMGRTRVRLRVVSLVPTNKPALLLTNDTEVAVAPKSRHAHTSTAKSTDNPAKPGKPHSVQGSAPAQAVRKSQRLRVLSCIGVHIAGSIAHACAFVSRSTLSRLTFLTLTDDDFVRCSMKRISPPSNPTNTADISQLIDSKNSHGAQLSASPSEHEIWLGVLDTGLVPDEHVRFLRGSSPSGVADFDILRVTCHDEKKSKHVLLPKEAQVDLGLEGALESDTSLAGVDEILKRCTDFGFRSLKLHSGRPSTIRVSALLLTGRAGAGKTSILKAVTKSLSTDRLSLTYDLYIDCQHHTDLPVAKLKSLFKYWFALAQFHRPSTITIDNIEKILPSEVEHADSFRSRHLAELFVEQLGLRQLDFRGIVLFASSQSQAAIHPILATTHIFQEIVSVKPPTKSARRDILKKLVERRLSLAPDIQYDSESQLNYTSLATLTEGYSATDLNDLVARAVHDAATKSGQDHKNTVLGSANFDAAQLGFVPLSLRDMKLQKSEVAWSDIGGLKDTRRILRETLEWPTKYGPIFTQSPLRLRSGLLLYGFPGCGKTLLASAVAKECGLNFISVKGPEILNKYIGASEKSVRDLFERASAAKPCVLFFDEFDSIAPKRGHDSTGVTDRVVNQMLTQMDGAEGLDGVYVLAATSRPDLIDSALLRPGRLDKSLLCDMPDEGEREDILKAVSRNVLVDPHINWRGIAEATDGFSGADLQALVYNAHLEVVHSFIVTDAGLPSGERIKDEAPIEYVRLGSSPSSGITSRAEESAIQRRLRQIMASSSITSMNEDAQVVARETIKHSITEDNIRQVLRTTRPSLSQEERGRLGRIYRAFLDDRSAAVPDLPELGGVGIRASLM